MSVCQAVRTSPSPAPLPRLSSRAQAFRLGQPQISAPGADRHSAAHGRQENYLTEIPVTSLAGRCQALSISARFLLPCRYVLLNVIKGGVNTSEKIAIASEDRLIGSGRRKNLLNDYGVQQKPRLAPQTPAVTRLNGGYSVSVRSASGAEQRLKVWQRLKLRIIGYVRVLEWTYGKHGHHPRFHTILLVRADSEDDAVEMVRACRQHICASFRELDGMARPAPLGSDPSTCSLPPRSNIYDETVGG